nr:putative ribonuclease H-like domain-containing protein [Tanacetum cinerariifolium]
MVRRLHQQDQSNDLEAVGNKMHKAFPLPVTEFPLPEKIVATVRRKEKPLPRRSHCYQFFNKWYQSLMRNFDQQKNKIQDQQKKKMMKKSSSSENESCCSKDCKKNTKTLNKKITDLSDKLFDANNMIYHYKLALAQVESRIVEYKEREVKYCEKIITLEFHNESKNESIEILKKKLETLKLEKDRRSDKIKDGLGYSDVPPPAQLYLSPKKDLSWTGLPECVDDTVTDYSMPSPTVESASGDDQNRNPSVSETVASPITPKPFIKFVKPKDSQSKSNTSETESPKKPPVKYAEQYRKPNKKPNITGKGTIKTGTKDDAGQKVKKDVSTLRYIALPNWAHDAFLESSLSKSQDDCNTDVPKSSGNTNPTATSTIPSADQLETLTVESLIPTASSSVPTACFTGSQEPSSKTRLISKRVANQEETPSLDNILTLTNRFEYILKVTINSKESNGVEADVSNIETTITASPTPTLSIHKDYLKSQIIGPVDTLIQTRNKFKEVGEQGFIATIHQKTDPALLQFCLFSCFLSQVEPKKISDALQDPSWVEAMQEELLLFKIQKVWTLVDCPKGVRPIGTKWVLKNKKDERGIVIKNKARLVAQRHTQEEGIDYDEVFSPVSRIEAIRLFLAYASFMGFIVYQIDVKSAFLYGTIDEEVYVMQPPGFQDP